MSAGAGGLCLFRIDECLLWWNVCGLHVVNAQIQWLFLAGAAVCQKEKQTKFQLASKYDMLQMDIFRLSKAATKCKVCLTIARPSIIILHHFYIPLSVDVGLQANIWRLCIGIIGCQRIGRRQRGEHLRDGRKAQRGQHFIQISAKAHTILGCLADQAFIIFLETHLR